MQVLSKLRAPVRRLVLVDLCGCVSLDAARVMCRAALQLAGQGWTMRAFNTRSFSSALVQKPFDVVDRTGLDWLSWGLSHCGGALARALLAARDFDYVLVLGSGIDVMMTERNTAYQRALERACARMQLRGADLRMGLVVEEGRQLLYAQTLRLAERYVASARLVRTPADALALSL